MPTVLLYDKDGDGLYVTLAHSRTVWRVREPSASAFADDAARLLAEQTGANLEPATLADIAGQLPDAYFDDTLHVEETLSPVAQRYIYGDTYE